MSKIPKIIAASIDLTKIDRSRIIKGKNGAEYVDLTLVNTPGNQYGKDYLVKQDFGKEAREQRIETPILGNAKSFLHDQGTTTDDAGGSPAPAAPSASSGGVGSSTLSDLPF